MRRKRSASSESRLTLRRSTPAARSGAASSASRWPLVDSAMLVEARDRAQQAHQRRQIAAHRRLAAGEAHAAHAQRRRTRAPARRSPRTRARRRGRACVDAVVGDAVGAAVVAAIGHRHAQVVDDARLRIDEPGRPRRAMPTAASALMVAMMVGACSRGEADRRRGRARARSAGAPPARPPRASRAAGTPARPPTTPASARDSIAAGPISWNDSMRNSSPKPGRRRSNSAPTASGVRSRGPMPVPPVTMTASLVAAPAARDRVAQRRRLLGEQARPTSPRTPPPRPAGAAAARPRWCPACGCRTRSPARRAPTRPTGPATCGERLARTRP